MQIIWHEDCHSKEEKPHVGSGGGEYAFEASQGRPAGRNALACERHYGSSQGRKLLEDRQGSKWLQEGEKSIEGLPQRLGGLPPAGSVPLWRFAL